MNGQPRSIEPTKDFDLLDRLLAAAPMPQPDPWFAARTLARCRSSRPEVLPVVSWSSIWRRWAVLIVLVLSLAGFGLQQLYRNNTLRRHHLHSAQEAFEVISKVDNDTDLSWQDSSL